MAAGLTAVSSAPPSILRATINTLVGFIVSTPLPVAGKVADGLRRRSSNGGLISYAYGFLALGGTSPYPALETRTQTGWVSRFRGPSN